MTSGHAAYVDYCGEIYPIAEGEAVVVGRDADVVLDDNQYLHRRFLHVSLRDGLLWLENVGGAMTATVADEQGLVQSWLAPGARVPLVFPRTMVWFSAGPMTYELEIGFNQAPFATRAETETTDGATTIGRVSFTPDQRLLVLSLAEDILRRGNRGAGAIPASAVAAQRLGWTQTKFNRKLDNVCEKLSKLGVRGLVTEGDRVASNRRARLVEYVLATRLITTDDLVWLDAVDPAD